MKPFVIGICGGSGSGKTQFSHELRDSINHDAFNVITQDNYYFPRDRLTRDNNGLINYDVPIAIDHEAFATDIESLKSGNPVQKRFRKHYTSSNESEYAYYLPSPLILVEGMYAFYFSEVSKLIDYKIYVHAEDTTRLMRRIRRDTSSNLANTEQILERYENHIIPSYHSYIQPFMKQAHIIVNSETQMNLTISIISGHLKTYKMPYP